ncbi:conserved Plasmodium membrane protein, unknown function [Plasmodium reichenowi]|uniref:Transporter n=1 Tax=Plasmodium reichenowi TaxID=5854 RepID=A0A060RNG3_PLARE|nr:conserved Plasmodium membrane protein, unknown function [Plasmodium reichenowi]
MMDVYKEENSDLLNHQEEEISRNSNINDEFSETQLRDNVYEEREDEYINKHNMMDDIQIMVDEQDNNNNYDNNNYYDDNINNYDNNNYYDDNINNYDNNNYDDNTNNNSYYEYNQNAYDDNEPYNDNNNNNNNIINGSEYINEIEHNDEELYDMSYENNLKNEVLNVDNRKKKSNNYDNVVNSNMGNNKNNTTANGNNHNNNNNNNNYNNNNNHNNNNHHNNNHSNNNHSNNHNNNHNNNNHSNNNHSNNHNNNHNNKSHDVKDIPYCSFNNFQENEDKDGDRLGDVKSNNNMLRKKNSEENNAYNLFNNEKLKKLEKKKKKLLEKNKKKKKEDTLDDKKFSEVYNSIYENLKKKKEGKYNNDDNKDMMMMMDDHKSNDNKHYKNNKHNNKHYNNNNDDDNDFYEINYNSSDNMNSVSSVEEDTLFNDDVLKKYIIGQVLNIIRTSFHWAITSFVLFFLFEHFSIFYVYRLISFLTLFLFTPISIYLVKRRNIKFFLIFTNTVRLLIWGFFIPFLYFLYKNEIKKYYVNRTYEFLFSFFLLLDNIQINISNLIDIDNNGIDFLSKKYDLRINEKAKRKFLTLHQFFFDASFIVVNPLIIFVMYLFSNLFNENYYKDVFIYTSSFIFSVITIITLVVYTLGLENVDNNQANKNNDYSTNYEEHNTNDSIEDINEDISYNNNEDNFDKYYEKQKQKQKHKKKEFQSSHTNSINNGYTDTYNNTYPNIYNDQTKKYLTERSNLEYMEYVNENYSLQEQYKRQFSELINNIHIIKKENTLLFYTCMLSYLNSVEDIMILMLIPLTSIYVAEFFYLKNIFVQILMAVLLISLTKCFENISYYSNKKNIIALKDIFIGIILSGISLVLFFFPFLMLNHLNIYSFLIFYIICCLFYFFFSTNLKTTLSLNLQKTARETKSDIYNFVGLFMSFVNLIFVILTSFFLSILDNFVINYVFICIFLIILLVLFYAWAVFILKRGNNSN